MSALSDYTDAVATLVTGAATFEALADDVQAKAATAGVRVGDTVQAICLRAEQAEEAAAVLTAQGTATTARGHYYLNDAFPNGGT